MSINEKLLAIQNELKAPKNQYNKFGNFYYRSCEDILEGLKPVLKKNKASLIVSDEIVQIGDRFYVKANAILTDIETGDSLQSTAFAREETEKKGLDSSQITGSSSSYARKFALNGLFLIDDTKDADRDNNEDTQTDEQKNKEMKAKVDQDLVPHGEGMTPKRIARLKKAQEICGKNDATVLATAKAKKIEDITEESYIAVMNLFLNLMTPEQKKEIEAI